MPSHEHSPVPNSNKSRHEHTAKRKFNPESNPHDLVRCAQKEKYVWYATYDEEMQIENFKHLLKFCNDQSAPIVIFNTNHKGS